MVVNGLRYSLTKGGLITELGQKYISPIPREERTENLGHDLCTTLEGKQLFSGIENATIFV